MTTRNEFNKQTNLVRGQADFTGHRDNVGSEQADFAQKQGYAIMHSDFARKRNDSAGGYDFAGNLAGNRADNEANIAGKQRNFAKEEASAVGRQGGILSRLGSWKHVALMAIVFIWIAVGCFAAFKALNTETIVTEDPQTVSATYEQKQASYNESAAPAPSVPSVA